MHSVHGAPASLSEIGSLAGICRSVHVHAALRKRGRGAVVAGALTCPRLTLHL